MTLDLIVTHYKSPFEVGKPFFDMLALQRNVDFDNIGVIVVNDGEESALPDELFKDYPYHVTNMVIPHGGVSVARNAGLDMSEADWVMVCDFDDQIHTTLGLQHVFNIISEDDKDFYWTPFLEEVVRPDGSIVIVEHEKDTIFVHGKIYRRKWLEENNIRNCDGLTLHEDVFINVIADAIAKPERIGTIGTGFYLWCNNPNSVGHQYRDFIFETYEHMMKQRNAIAKEFKKRGIDDQVMITVCKTVVDAFYDFQGIEWTKPENVEQYRLNERWFCTFFKRYGGIYASTNPIVIAKLIDISRKWHIKQGLFMVERIAIGDWLVHIMNDVKPFDTSVLDV